MASTRAYRRDNHGRFAGSGSGSMTTYGKAGGFANAAFRSRASSTNQRASMRRSFGLGRTVRRHAGQIGVTLAAGGAAAVVASGGGGRYKKALTTTAVLGSVAAAISGAKRSTPLKTSATAARGSRLHR
jgi:hypothetical protein